MGLTQSAACFHPLLSLHTLYVFPVKPRKQKLLYTVETSCLGVATQTYKAGEVVEVRKTKAGPCLGLLRARGGGL